MSEEVRSVSAAAFAALDKNDITVVDVREPDEILVHPVGGAINVPFSAFPIGLDDIPREKDVYVLCRTGDFSAEVAEILADRGYTAFNVEDGYQAIKALAPCLHPMAVAPDGLIEAVCAPEKRFVWAVQWHPEFFFRKDETSRTIFAAFVNAAR